MSDNPMEPVEEVAAEDFIEATEAEAIETEGETQSDATEEIEEELPVYYEIDGEEVSLEDVRKWKSGHMMQSDYTKKTQALSEESKAVKSQRAELTQSLETLASIESEIEQLIIGDLGVDLDELREENTGEYLRLKEQQEARKAKLGELKNKVVEKKNALTLQNAQRLHDSLGWIDEFGNFTDKKSTDLKAILDYKQSAGIEDDDFKAISSPAVMQALLDAAKYQKLMENKPDVVKKVVKAPKAIKPKATQPKRELSLAERMYGTN